MVTIYIKASQVCFSRYFCSSVLHIPNRTELYPAADESAAQSLLLWVCSGGTHQDFLSLISLYKVRSRANIGSQTPSWKWAWVVFTDCRQYSLLYFGMYQISRLAHSAVPSEADFPHHPAVRIWPFTLILIWSFPAESNGSPSPSERVQWCEIPNLRSRSLTIRAAGSLSNPLHTSQLQ